MKTLMMLVGPSYSGKSTFARMVQELMPERVKIFSSDDIREEIFGDACCQDEPRRVFKILQERIIKCLKEEDDVVAIYDATNISSKIRRNFLDSIRTIACRRSCVVFPVPLEELLERIPLRNRKVPDDVIIRQIKNFQCPQKSEGWDDIAIEFKGEGYDNEELMEKCKGFDQKNCYHTLSLYDHMKKTADVISSLSTSNFIHYDVNNPEVTNDACKLLIAAYFHDLGKLTTQEVDESGEAHYYNHHYVSAYMFLCMRGIRKLVENKSLTQQDVLDIVFLIQNHMEFYIRNERGIATLEQSTTPTLFNSLKLLHAADIAAR